MNRLTYKYNHILVGAFVIAPFLAFFIEKFLNIDFNRTMQGMTYIGVLLMFLLKNKGENIIFPRYLFFYLLFIFYIFFSTFILLDREFNVNYLFSNYLIGSFNMMLIIENLHITKEKFKSIVKYSKFILFLAFVVIVYQQAVNPYFFVSVGEIEEVGRFSSDENRLPSIYSWLGSLSLGFGFVPIFILVIDLLERHQRKIIIWIIIGLTVAFLSKARWVMLNSLLVFVLLIINNWKRSSRMLKYIVLIPVIIILSFTFSNLIGIDVQSIINNRVLESDKQNLSQTSAGTRILAFEAFNRLYWDKPILGTGNIKYGMGGTGEQEYKLRSFLRGRSSQIHVGYLSLFYLYGLVGGALFLSFLFLLLKKLYYDAKQTHIWAPFLGFFGLALANWTLVAFSVFEMGLIIVLVANKFYLQNLYNNPENFA